MIVITDTETRLYDKQGEVVAVFPNNIVIKMGKPHDTVCAVGTTFTSTQNPFPSDTLFIDLSKTNNNRVEYECHWENFLTYMEAMSTEVTTNAIWKYFKRGRFYLDVDDKELKQFLTDLFAKNKKFRLYQQ